MPGDLHIHMILDGVNFRTAIDAHKQGVQDSLIRPRLEEYRRRGITFLRDGGDAWGVCLRARALAGEYGIDYRAPGFPIYMKGHYGAFIGRGFRNREEYKALLGELHKLGADFVKLMIAGLMDFSRADTLTELGPDPEIILRMVEEARKEGFAVMVHANGDPSVCAAVEAGAASVEHGAYLSRDTLERMARAGILWVPTLSTIGNLIGCGRFPDGVLVPLLKAQQTKVRAYADLGGPVGLGSDAGAFRVLHGQAAEDEYGYLQQALGERTDAIIREGEEITHKTFKIS